MSTKTRARNRARTQPAAAEPAASLSCEVCHVPGDETTLKNHGTKTMPYYMCIQGPARECDKRAGIIRDEAIAGDEAQAEAATQEPAEVSQ